MFKRGTPIYTPVAQVCLDSKTDRRREGHQRDTAVEEGASPRETVAIHLSSLATCEAVAAFYSYLAYPDLRDARERERYRIALSRWAVLRRCASDKAWSESTDMAPSIRPIVFSQPEHLYNRTCHRGGKSCARKLICAHQMLFPDEEDELSPTVGNLSLLVGRTIGYSDESQKTVESKIWGPTKAIAHAAATVLLYFAALPQMGEWDENHKLCYKDPHLATFFYEDVFMLVLETAESVRLQLPNCNRFDIRANETIKFIAD
jgi:hypothetical protein